MLDEKFLGIKVEDAESLRKNLAGLDVIRYNEELKIRKGV